MLIGQLHACSAAGLAAVNRLPISGRAAATHLSQCILQRPPGVCPRGWVAGGVQQHQVGIRGA